MNTTTTTMAAENRLKTKGTVFGSSPSIGMATELIARFYCTDKQNIHLTKVEGARSKAQWTVKVGDKDQPNVRVFPERGRFYFAKCLD